MPIMAHQHKAVTKNTIEWKNPHNIPPLNIDNICNSMNYAQNNKLTRSKLKWENVGTMGSFRIQATRSVSRAEDIWETIHHTT